MGRGRPRTKHFTRGRPSNRVAVDRKPIRPLERQRMRPWLTQLLDSSECKQLRWIRKHENTFKISWKHAAGQTFNAKEDCTLFERWARHTGKYYDGDKQDPKRWKANFRCALNSLLDVEEDKSQGVKKGNEAFKVYRFLGEKRPKKGRKRPREAEEEYLDNELKFLRNVGTKSRPKGTKMEEDSYGSEGMGSPATSDGDNSDWSDSLSGDLRLRCQEEKGEEDTAEKSPLPDFEKLCQSVNIFPQHECSQDTLAGGHSPCRLPETYSPRASSDSANTDTDEVSSYAGSCHSGEINNIEIYVDEAGFWNEFLQCDTKQEPLEQIVEEDGQVELELKAEPEWMSLSQFGETQYISLQPSMLTECPQEGPNVIVMTSDSSVPDYEITSMTNMEYL